ncbi:putative lipase [Campylobacter lari]|uniref:hypothetical protein n=1 Tax=Campylobacter lari TaxID=201 RepID=UPI0021521166|nr:hypothetical protein [Campylobacter lari]MCR6530165.1 hypothetical protein [Campylobacter lari]
MNPKELISQIKDYADIADASYAMLDLIDENDEKGFFDSAFTPPLWLYADGIKLGYEIEDKHIQNESSKSLILKNKREIGDPTAYATIIEARFSADLVFKKPRKDNEALDEDQVIGNKAQSFIYRNQEDKEAIKQEYLLALNFAKHNEDPRNLRHHLSPRTKNFVSRYEVIDHVKNTNISGYSHTVFKDTSKNDNTYILAFRGTETGGTQLLKDAFFTDGFIALGLGIPQVVSLMNYSDEVLKIIREKHGSDNFKIDVVGHSLGGHLAQCFCIFGQKKYIQKLYTYNGAGIEGVVISLINIFIRVIRVVFKLLIKGIKKLFGFGMTRKTLDNCSKVLNVENGTDGLIEECKNSQGQIDQKRLDECALNIKQASKGKTSIEIHHIETIAKPIPNEEDFSREYRQALESSRSVIADLGYKYGLDIKDKFDYKNTDKLHLIHIGELEKNYLLTSHFMYNIVWASYFYEHLIKNNENIKEFKKDIACAMDYLNSYAQNLIDLSEKNKLLSGDKIDIQDENQNYISVVLDKIFDNLCKNSVYNKKEFNLIYKDIQELFYVSEYKNVNKFVIPDSFLVLEAMQIYIKILDKPILEKLSNKDFKQDLDHAEAVYKWLPFIVKDKNNQKILTEDNIGKILNYNSECFKCLSLENDLDFFQARKKQMINLIYENNCTSYYLNKNQPIKTKVKFNSSSSTIFVNLPKEEVFIFANCRDLIDCDEIYKRVATKVGIAVEELQNYQAYIFLNSTLLTGSSELPNNPFYFGELDQDNAIKQDAPSYYFSPKDENSGKGKLSIFYKNDELCLLNYSIIENSLNIKLECLSKQSLEYKDLISNTLKEQKTIQINKKQAIAKLHALLENQNLECIHGGKVILQSNKGKTFKDGGVPIMLESDLLNSSISGCPNTIGKVSYPCTKVVDVKGSLSQKKVNNEYVILQELISACVTDKGYPLKVSFVPTKFKFDHSFNPKEGLAKQSKSQTKLKEPIIRLHYKSDRFQKDNLPIYNLLINNEKKEQNKALSELNIDQKDLKDIEDVNILNQFKQDFSKDYEFKELNFSFDTNLIKLYFIIPKNIAKVYKSAYKEFEYKDLGAGYFTQLHEYDKIIKNSLEDNKELNEYHFSFLAPAKMQNLKFQIANGLDEILEDEDRKQELYVCKFVVVNGIKI